MISRSLDNQELELVLVQYDTYMNAINSHAIVAVTDQRGIISYVNDAFIKISKYDREELIGSTHRIVNSGFHTSHFFEEMWKTISSGQTWKGEIRNRAKDGTIYWMATTIVPFRNGNGEIYQYVSLRTDITHLKNLEQQLELEKSMLEIRVAEKTHALNQANQFLLDENRENRKLTLEIKEQKEAYAYLFNQASDAIVIVDATDGKIIQLNNKAGLFVDLVHGVSDRVIFYTTENCESYIDLKSLSPGKVHHDLIIKDTRGNKIYVDVSVNQALWGEREILQAIIHDMSEQKQLEKQLKHEAAHNRLLEIISSEANRSTDVDAFIWTCIELICRKFSWDFGHIYKVNSQNSIKIFPTNIWFQSGQADFEIPIVDATYETVFHPGEGSIGRCYSSQRPVFIEDVRKLSPAEYLRKEAAVASDIRSVCCVPVKVQDEVTHVIEFFSTLVVPFTESQVQLLEHTTNQIARVVELCEAREELEKKQSELRNSSRLAGLGLLSSGIAHEINNPLTIIAVKTDMLISDLEDKIVDVPRLLENLKKIKGTTQRIMKVIKGLRSMSRDAACDPFLPVIFNTCLEDTLGVIFEGRENEGIEIHTYLLDHPVEIECRSAQLCQVIANLVGNALDAVRDLKDKWISISMTEDDNYVELAVTDSGKGIPEDLQSRIFDAFFTTKGVGKGTGLGLSISKSIVDGHKGSLSLDTESPYTKFVMRLPKKQVKAINEAEKSIDC